MDTVGFAVANEASTLGWAEETGGGLDDPYRLVSLAFVCHTR
jgi:hypothetical protein